VWRGSEKKKGEGAAERSRQVSVRESWECAWKMDLGVACCRSCVLQDDERERVRDAFEKNRFNI